MLLHTGLHFYQTKNSIVDSYLVMAAGKNVLKFGTDRLVSSKSSNNDDYYYYFKVLQLKRGHQKLFYPVLNFLKDQ